MWTVTISALPLFSLGNLGISLFSANDLVRMVLRIIELSAPFLWTVAFGSVILVFVFYFLLRKKLTLSKELKPETEEDLPVMNQSIDLIGASGFAITDLRPLGKASFEEKEIDVTSTGKFVKKNTPVRVIKVEGSKVIVESLNGLW